MLDEEDTDYDELRDIVGTESRIRYNDKAAVETVKIINLRIKVPHYFEGAKKAPRRQNPSMQDWFPHITKRANQFNG